VSPAGRGTAVLIGGGLASAKAAEGLRAAGYPGRIVLVGAEPTPPYDRPPLSKESLTTPAEDAGELLPTPVHAPDWYDEADVELRLGVTVAAIDVADRAVELSDGTRLDYDEALLATGATPRTLPAPGGDRPGLLTLRSLDDARRLSATLTGLADTPGPAGRLVVIGAGWIGLEVTAAARARGVEVTLVDPLPVPLGAVLGAQVGAVFADLHRRHGVDLRLGLGVRGIDDTGVHLTDGTKVAAGGTLVAVGVRPAVQLAEQAGVAVAGGAVAVDAMLRTSAPGLWAAGDVVTVAHAGLAGEQVHVEHWANAHDQGLAVGAAMAGVGRPWDVLPFFYTDQYELGMEYHGWVGPAGFDDVVIRGDTQALDFDAFWCRDGRILAGMHVNRWDDSEPIKQLAATRARPPRARLADPGVPLADLLDGQPA
jgi:3-phenylpropionate/trans-cinnamate dioxygenase ferredoxin reductase subunit